MINTHRNKTGMPGLLNTLANQSFYDGQSSAQANMQENQQRAFMRGFIIGCIAATLSTIALIAWAAAAANSF